MNTTARFFLVQICLILAGTAAFSQDMLDQVQSDSKLVQELKDMYRAYKVNLTISDQKELLRLYISDEDDEAADTAVVNFIKDCEILQELQFYNDTLGALAKNYVTLTIESYRIGTKYGFTSKEYAKNFTHYGREKEKYLDYMIEIFPTTKYVKFTEEEYWKNIDKKNYIKSPDYATYDSLKSTDIKAALTLLNNIASFTSEFQEYSIYLIEYADQCVKKYDSLDFGKELSGHDVAIQNYKALIDRYEYNLYLFEAWLKWRAVTQQWIGGLSKSSDIPNNEYNKVREEVAVVILNYITTHPTDEMAINEFMLMASHDIIRRFGAYPYGNQNTVEYHRFFDEE